MNDYVSKDAIKNYIQGYIHEIITESGIDKNEHTNRILRSIINGIDNINCADCILDGTDACSRGAGRAVDDEICERFLGG